MFRFGVLVLLAVPFLKDTSALAEESGRPPPPPSSCPLTGCGRVPSFKQNHTYVYDYGFVLSIETNETETFSAHKIELQATAEIHSDQDCKLSLKLDEVKVEHVKNNQTNEEYLGNDEDLKLLAQNPLVFQYGDGKISQICPDRRDPLWVVNIKLGVLSALQYTWNDTNATYTLLETNNIGECRVSYTTSRADGWRVLRSDTALNDCSYRAGMYNITQSLLPIKDNFVPFVKNTQRCRRVLGKDGEPILVTCREYYPVFPFSDTFTVRTTIKQQMDLNRVVLKDEPEYEDEEFESLESRAVFEFENEDHESEISVVDVILDQMRRTKKEDDFYLSAEMIDAIRDSSYNDIQSAIRRCNETEKKYLYKMLLQVVTDETVQVLIDLHRDSEITDGDLLDFVPHLPFMESPTTRTLNLIQDLLNVQSLKPSIQLSAGGVVFSYCKDISDCLDHPEVESVMKTLEIPLMSRVGKSISENVIVALKSIGNAGVTNMKERILLIAQDKNMPNLMRIVAIEAFRRMKCDEFPSQNIIDIFANTKEDLEVRWNSFLAAIRCPSRRVMDRMIDTLVYDKVNEVTQYAWNYLVQDDLRESNSVAYEFLTNEIMTEKYAEIDAPQRRIEVRQTDRDGRVTLTTQRLDRRSQSFEVVCSFGIFNETLNALSFGGRVEGLGTLLKTVDEVSEGLDCAERQFLERLLSEASVTLENSMDNSLSEASGARKVPVEGLAYDGRLMVRVLDVELVAWNSSYSEAVLRQIYTDRLLGLAANRSFELVRSFDFLNVAYRIPTTVGLVLDIVLGAKVDVEARTVVEVKSTSCTTDPSSLVTFASSVVVSSGMETQLGQREIGITYEEDIAALGGLSQGVDKSDTNRLKVESFY